MVTQVLPAKLLQHGLLSFGFTGPTRSELQYCFLLWSPSLLWASSCSDVGSPMGCRWISLPQWTSMLCSGVWNTSCPSFCIHFGICSTVILPCSYSHLPAAIAFFFVPLNMLSPIKSVIPPVLLLSLLGSALASCGAILEPSDVGSHGHGGSFWQLLMEASL